MRTRTTILFTLLIAISVMCLTGCPAQPPVPTWSSSLYVLGDGNAFYHDNVTPWPTLVRQSGQSIVEESVDGFGIDASLTRGSASTNLIQTIAEKGCPKKVVIVLGTADFLNVGNDGLLYTELQDIHGSLTRLGCDFIWVVPPTSPLLTSAQRAEQVTYNSWLASNGGVLVSGLDAPASFGSGSQLNQAAQQRIASAITAHI